MSVTLMVLVMLKTLPQILRHILLTIALAIGYNCKCQQIKMNIHVYGGIIISSQPLNDRRDYAIC